MSRPRRDDARRPAPDPGSGFTGVSDGAWATLERYYRLIDAPEVAAETWADILAPHQQQTQHRMAAQATVLCVQEGTDLDFGAVDEETGWEVLDPDPNGAETRRLHLHTTLAIATHGLPLGVLQAQLQAPPAADGCPSRSVAAQERDGWIEALRHTAAIAAQMPQTRLITVADRRTDVAALFDEQRRHPQVDLIVSTKPDRRLGPVVAERLAAIAATEIRATIQVPVGRQNRTLKRRPPTAADAPPERTAHLALRYQTLTLPALPTAADTSPPVTVWAIHAQEPHPPEGYPPIEWYLLTTIALDQPEQAIDCLRWYCLRWRLESWSRVLKAGCRVQRLANVSLDSLSMALANYLVITWRLLVLTLIGRESPQLPPQVAFSDLELEVLDAIADQRRRPPPQSLGDATVLMARLGGYLARRRDPPPGHQHLWQGYTHLQGLAYGFVLAKDAHA